MSQFSPVQSLQAISKFRERYPQYAEVDGDRMAEAIEAKFPQYAGISGAYKRYASNAALSRGEALELAAFRVDQMSAERGARLGENEQKAVVDAYLQRAGDDTAASPDNFAAIRERQAEQRTDTVGGRLQTAALSGINSLGQTAANLAGVVAPEFAEDYGQQIQTTLNPGDSRAASAGALAAEGGKLVAAAPLGGAGLAGFYGAQGFGGTRRETEALRDQEAEIGLGRELGTATAVGAVEGLSGLAGGVIFGRMARALKGIGTKLGSKADPNAVAKTVKAALKAGGLAVAEGAEEAVTQAVTNKVKQVGINPEQAVLEGLDDAFLAGMILSPLGAGGINSRPFRGPKVAEAVRQTPQDAPTPLGLPSPEEASQTSQARQQAAYDEARAAIREAEAPLELEEGTALGSEQGQGLRVSPDGTVRTPEGQERFEADRDAAGQAFLREQGLEPNPEYRPDEQPASPPELSIDEVLDSARSFEPTIDAVRPMLGDGPFVAVEVPTQLLNESVIQGSDVNQDKLSRATEQLAAGSPAPPVIAAPLGMGDKAFIADGTHRLLAAKEAGKPTVSALVPKDWAAENGLLNDAPTAPRYQATPRPLGLPAPSARFVAGESGRVTDLENPTPPRERRDPAQAEARQQVEALTAEGRLEEAQTEIERLKREARTDALTGLGNKRAWDEEVASLREEADRTGVAKPFIFFDAANMKAGNSKLGHEQMDAILQRMASTMQEVAGSGAKVFRQGGDEFAVVLPKGGRRKHKQVMEQIEKALGFTEIVPGVSFFLSGGVGVYQPGSGQEGFSAEYTRADQEEAEARKKQAKQARGEVVERSEAEELVNQSLAAEEGATPQQSEEQWAADVQRRQDEAREVSRARNERIREKFLKAKNQAEREAILRESREDHNGNAVASWELTEGAADRHNRLVPKGVEHLITPIASRLRDLSPRLFGRLQQMYLNAGQAAEALKRNFTGAAHGLNYKGLSRSTRRKFKAAVLEGRFDDARALFPDAQQAHLDTFINTFQLILAQAKEYGISLGEVANYWPRYVKNYEKFRQLLGTDDKGLLDEALSDAEVVKGKPLTDTEKTDVINSLIQGYGPRVPGQTGQSNTRRRKFQEIPKEALDLYVDPIESAMRYVDEMSYMLEKAKFLGKATGTVADTDIAVGEVLRPMVEEGSLSRADQAEVDSLLRTLFTADLIRVPRAIRAFKQFTYFTMLNQVGSTVTQLADLLITAVTHPTTTIPAAAEVAAGLAAGSRVGRAVLPERLQRRLRHTLMEELGIHDHGEEFKDVGKMAKTLDTTLTVTGFRLMDRFGKETRINAARRQFERAARNPNSRGYRKLRREFVGILTPAEFDAAMADFAAGRNELNGASALMLFIDIAKVQPITAAQMPAFYHTSPSHKLLYILKSFTVTQLDNMRREGLRKMAHGETWEERAEGAAWMARYIVFLMAADFGIDLIKDWIRGKEIHADQVPDRTIASALALVGLHRFGMDKVLQGDIVGGAGAVIGVPASFFNNVGRDAYRATQGDLVFQGGDKGLKSIPNLAPAVGDFIYFHTPFGDGHRLNAEARKKAERDRTEAIRDAAYDFLLQDDSNAANKHLQIYNEIRRTQWREALELWREEGRKGKRPAQPQPVTIGGLRQRQRKEAE